MLLCIYLNTLRGTYAQQTALPSNAFESSASIPNGATRTFTKSGGTNAYSDGASVVTIDSGGDTYTRPPSYAINWIIKHD